MKQVEKLPKGQSSQNEVISHTNFNESKALKIADHEIEIEDPFSSRSPLIGGQFDLTIANVELSHLYKFQPTEENSCSNAVNSWLNENILYWDIEGKKPQFCLPETQFGMNPMDIVPTQLVHRTNSFILPSSLLSSTDKYSHNGKIKEEKESRDKKAQYNQLPSQKVYDSLNSSQLSNIWNKGLFTVYYGYGEPESWILRPWVFYGKERSAAFMKEVFRLMKFQFKQILRRQSLGQSITIVYAKKQAASQDNPKNRLLIQQKDCLNIFKFQVRKIKQHNILFLQAIIDLFLLLKKIMLGTIRIFKRFADNLILFFSILYEYVENDTYFFYFFRVFTWETIQLIAHNRKNMIVNSESCQCSCLELNILEAFRVMIGVPVHLFILFIGIPLFDVDEGKLKEQKLLYYQSKIEDEIRGRSGDKYADVAFLQHLMKNKEIYLNSELSFEGDNEMVALLKQIQSGQILLPSSENQAQLIKIELQSKLYEQMLQKTMKYLQEKQDVSEDILKSMENTFRAYVSMNTYANLHKQYPQLFGNPEDLLKQLKEKKCNKQQDLASMILSQLRKGVSLFQEMRISNKIKETSRKNQLQFMYFKPKVVREVGENGQVIFKAKWTSEITIPTSFFFWKIIFFCVAFYFMIHKFIHSLIYFAIFSPCGIKAALYRKRFANNFKVDPRTGRIVDDLESMEETVTSIYNNIKELARNNVRKFENEPDHGLLGKSIVRICNRLENWVLRYFLLGFILVNILLRLVFIIIGTIALILVPLSLVLAPVYTVLCLFLCLFCYDFTVPNRHQNWDLPILAPIFDLLILRLIIKGIGQIFLCIFMMFFHAFLGAVIVAIGTAIYLLRRAIDLVVFLFLYTCGRVPGGDSYLAWRVSRLQPRQLQMTLPQDTMTFRKSNGNQALYSQHQSSVLKTGSVISDPVVVSDQLSQEQIHLLIDAEFEKEALELYRTDMLQRIKEPIIQNDNHLGKLFASLPFDLARNHIQSQYNASAEKLKSELAQSISRRKKTLPILASKGTNINFAYKREAVLSIFYDIQEYTKNKYSHNQQYSGFMWTSFGCAQGDYKTLAVNLMSLIFFKGAISPTAVIDRLTLKEPQGKNIFLKQQIDEFLSSQFKNPIQFIEPPPFIPFSMFIERALKRIDINQPLVSIHSENFLSQNEFMLLNILRLEN